MPRKKPEGMHDSETSAVRQGHSICIHADKQKHIPQEIKTR